MSIHTTAVKIIEKYLRKGNMTRCLRDILPSSGLSFDEREQVVDRVHTIVRWRHLYDTLLESISASSTAEAYLKLAEENAHTTTTHPSFSVKHSCSEYVASLLKKREEWATYLNQKPPTTLCVNLNTSTSESIQSRLSSEGYSAQQSVLPTAILTDSQARYSSVISNKEAHVQDENSQLIAYLAVSLGDSILDFCAGNGGKSLAMASLMQNTKTLHAYEINPKRHQTLQQRCREYQAQVSVDTTVPRKRFDVVLVDAPCTGIGATRRNPEAKYVTVAGEYPNTQLAILQSAVKLLKKNGVLLYVVCTITPEETSEVIQHMLQNTKLKDIPLPTTAYSKFFQSTDFGLFTTIPQGDLFFVSALQKKH